MDKSNANITLSEDKKNAISREKPLTSGSQGVANSHGVKLSVNMTSDDKKKLLIQLEEWRKSKREKIAAAMLAKQNQADKSKKSLPAFPLKNKPLPFKPSGGQERQSVFERLYKNEKIKKPEIPNFRQNSSEVSKPVPHPVRDQIKITETKLGPKNITQKNGSSETKPFVHPVNDQIEAKPILEGNDNKNKDAEIMLPADSVTPTNMNIEECHAPLNNDPDENAEKTASYPVNHAINIAGANPAPNSVNDHHKDENIKPVLYPTSGKIKSTIIKPVSLSTNCEMKTAESKPVKSELAKNSLPLQRVEAGRTKVILRRSLSMMFHQKKKEQNILRRSISTQNIPKLNVKTQKADHKASQILPPQPHDTKIEDKNKKSIKPPVFATPKSTKPLNSTHLRTKLEDWLKLNGHPLDGYRHLRCFGISDGQKPTPVTPAMTVNRSFEKSTDECAPNTPLDDSNKENVTPPTVIRQVSVKDVENWLKELHLLIVELKYPSERCEEWLAAIRKKCTSCTQLPIYWECLAALDESKGDIKSAIADYETAIIKGGEVETVGDSLAQLFDKMIIESEKRSKPKLEKGLDPKNIFKSTIIKFALQQKALKSLSSELEPGVRKQLYVATPVRRSTRIQTPSKSTDEVASLQTLTPELRKNVTFKPNESLLLD